MLGHDPFTPTLLQWLYCRLCEIEATRDSGVLRSQSQLFGAELEIEQISALESDLRTGFLMFCNRTPTLAAEYLRSQLQHRRRDRVAAGVLKFRGAIAQAAPAELAELTAATLIPEQPQHKRYPGCYDIKEPFD